MNAGVRNARPASYVRSAGRFFIMELNGPSASSKSHYLEDESRHAVGFIQRIVVVG